jgi:DNA-binding NarL/FixJ family response regulator
MSENLLRIVESGSDKSPAALHEGELLAEFRWENRPYRIVSGDAPRGAATLVQAGHVTIGGKVIATVECLHRSEHAENAGERVALLTGRELQIATMVARGRPNKQIAAALHISEWTVGTHMRRIFSKLKVHSRAAMVAILLAYASP